MRFPEVPSGMHRFWFGLFTLFWLLTTYGIPNNYVLFTPTEVPVMAVDRMIGLQVWSVWLYVGTYFMVAAAFLTASQRDLNDMFYTLFFAAAGSFFFFTFLPTSIDRSLYPIPPGTEPGMALALLEHIRKVDNSVNCAPSMHVVMGWSVVLSQRSRQWYMKVIALVAGLAIIYSTMGTKQHYFLDAVTGTMLAIVSFWTARRIQLRPLEMRSWLSTFAEKRDF